MGRYAVRFSVWRGGAYQGKIVTTLSAISKDHAIELAYERLDSDELADSSEELVFDAAQYLGPDRESQGTA